MMQRWSVSFLTEVQGRKLKLFEIPPLRGNYYERFDECPYTGHWHFKRCLGNLLSGVTLEETNGEHNWDNLSQKQFK